jgi:hypothetical protein
MSRTRFTRAVLQLQAVVLAASAVFVAGAAASPSAPHTQAGSATFTDPSGDAQGGPDVTRAAVSGDVATGSITLTVTALNYMPTTPDALERDVAVWLDTDLNRATGDPADGTEYALQAWNDPSGRWWDVLRWNGSDWDSVPETPSMRFTRQGDALSWTVAASDIGGATRFKFYVFAGTWNDPADRFDTTDEAPDTGLWSFDASTPTAPSPSPAGKTALLVSAPQATPPVAVAGKKLAVQFRVQIQRTEETVVIDITTGETRESMIVTWTPVSGKWSCAASIGGQALPARCSSFKGGLAKLSLAVPKTAKGKRLRISVKITAKDTETGKTLTATRVATFAVK